MLYDWTPASSDRHRAMCRVIDQAGRKFLKYPPPFRGTPGSAFG